MPKLRDERAQPFFDLLALVEPRPALRALGCGTGELTRELHRRLGCASTLDVDTSPVMLARAAPRAEVGLGVATADLGSYEADEPFDLGFSNAAVQVSSGSTRVRRSTLICSLHGRTWWSG